MKEFTDEEMKNWPQAIFREVLKGVRHPKALVVGPEEHPLNDPSVPVLAQIIDEIGGEIFIVDTQSSKRPKSFSGGKSFYGDLSKYIKNWAALVEFGVPLKKPNFALCDVAEMIFGNETFDIILDHFAFQFFVKEGGDLNYEKERLEKALKEYLRVLKRGGTLIIMSYNIKEAEADLLTYLQKNPFFYWLPARLKKSFLNVERRRVTDNYLIKLAKTISIREDGLYRRNKLWKSFGKEDEVGYTKAVRIGSEYFGMPAPRNYIIGFHNLLQFANYRGRPHLYRESTRYRAGVCYIIRKK